MENILDYFRVNKDIAFEQNDFNEYDGLIFSRISYVRFPKTDGKEITGNLCEICQRMTKGMTFMKQIYSIKEDFELLKLIADSKRYQNIVINKIKNEFSVEQNEQFYAVHFINKKKGNIFNIVSFRGTDGTAVGWKEDFDLCYKEVTFAQEDAKKFVKDLLPLFRKKDTYIVGHSKGGNLAVFAAGSLRDGLQNFIKKIYTYDSPGFNSQFYMFSNFEGIKNKIVAFTPDSSVIGRLLDTKYPVYIVKSKAYLLLQHNVYNWRIENNRFIYTDHYTRRSNAIKNYIENKLVNMSISEREQMVQQIYTIINSIEYDGNLSVDPNPLALVLRIKKLKKQYPELKEAFNYVFEDDIKDAKAKYIEPIFNKKRR